MTLTLALLVDATIVPAWVARLAQRLATLDDVRAACLLDAQTPPRPRTLLDSFLALDQRLQRGAPDLFAPTDLRSVLPNVSVLAPAQFQPNQVDILLSFRSPGMEPIGIPRLGLWTWNSLAASTGFRQVLTRAPLMTCDLLAHLPGGESKLLRRAAFATDWISATRNRNHFFIKAGSTLLWALKKLSLEGEEVFFQHAETFQQEQPGQNEPGVIEITSLAIKQAARKLEKYVRPRETWLLLAAQTPAGLLPALGAARPIVPPRGVYWADPMAVDRDGRVHVFVEEYVREAGRGRIVCLILENGQATARQVVLEQPYHLSYPFVFEWRGEMYMIPETSARRAVELYHCTRWPDRWEFAHNVMSGIYAVDSTLLEHGGRWWLFTNVKTGPGASSWDELHLFSADSPIATRWTPHPLNPVIADVRLARPAGRILEFEGQLYRPSQDCSLRYGYALNLNRIDLLTERAYAETRIETLRPRQGMRTLHTFARAGGWDIVDGATRNIKNVR